MHLFWFKSVAESVPVWKEHSNSCLLFDFINSSVCASLPSKSLSHLTTWKCHQLRWAVEVSFKWITLIPTLQAKNSWEIQFTLCRENAGEGWGRKEVNWIDIFLCCSSSSRKACWWRLCSRVGSVGDVLHKTRKMFHWKFWKFSREWRLRWTFLSQFCATFNHLFDLIPPRCWASALTLASSSSLALPWDVKLSLSRQTKKMSRMRTEIVWLGISIFFLFFLLCWVGY